MKFPIAFTKFAVISGLVSLACDGAFQAKALNIDGQSCLQEASRSEQTGAINCLLRLKSKAEEKTEVLRTTKNIISAFDCEAPISLPPEYFDPVYLRQASDLIIARTKFNCNLTMPSGKTYQRTVYAGMNCHRDQAKMLCSPIISLDGPVGILGTVADHLSTPFELPKDFPDVVEAYKKEWR